MEKTQPLHCRCHETVAGRGDGSVTRGRGGNDGFEQ